MSPISQFADRDIDPIVTPILAAKPDEIRSPLSTRPTRGLQRGARLQAHAVTISLTQLLAKAARP